jgi:hypothetical protein
MLLLAGTRMRLEPAGLVNANVFSKNREKFQGKVIHRREKAGGK